MMSMPSQKPIRAPPHLSEVSPLLPLKQFQCLSDGWWPTCPFKKTHLALPLSLPLSSRWSTVRCPWLCAHRVASSLTLQIFWDTNHLWRLPCLLASLISNFPSLQHVQCSTPTRGFDDGCQTLTHAGLGFPFHFSFLYSELTESIQAGKGRKRHTRSWKKLSSWLELPGGLALNMLLTVQSTTMPAW